MRRDTLIKALGIAVAVIDWINELIGHSKPGKKSKPRK